MRSALGVVMVVGLLALTACGDDDEGSELNPGPGPTSDPDEPPVAGVDHWHAAFGIYICDEFLDTLPETHPESGIHTHGDSVIHVHPFSSAASGDNATLGVFLDGAVVTLSDEELHVGPVPATYTEGGSTCDGEDAQLVVARWKDVQTSDDDPELVTEDMADVRFEEDGEGWVIAFVPEGTDIPKPESAERLAELGAVDTGG